MYETLPIIAAAAIDIDITMAFQMVLFLFLLVVLNFLLIQPYLEAVEMRKAGVQGSREDAAEFEGKAEAMLAEYETKMRQARRDASEVRDSLRNQGQQEGNELLGEARDEVGVKLLEERKKISKEVGDAEATLRERAESLSSVMVKKVLPS
jgi:F-type H+-transporting ATPase subunit b